MKQKLLACLVHCTAAKESCQANADGLPIGIPTKDNEPLAAHPLATALVVEVVASQQSFSLLNKSLGDKKQKCT